MNRTFQCKFKFKKKKKTLQFKFIIFHNFRKYLFKRYFILKTGKKIYFEKTLFHMAKSITDIGIFFKIFYLRNF